MFSSSNSEHITSDDAKNVIIHICDIISTGYQLYASLRTIHLTTRVYSIHIATNTFSNELLHLLDRLAESFIGHYTLYKIDFSNYLVQAMRRTSLINATNITELKVSVKNYIQLLTDNVETEIQLSDIVNIIHDISITTKKFIYLLRLE